MKRNGSSIATLAVAALAGSAFSYFYLEPGRDRGDALPVATARAFVATDCAHAITRVYGFRHVRPLISSEPLCESPRFEELRGAIGTLVEGMRAAGTVGSASVYVRDLQQGEWTWYNGDELYEPGSMLKIPLLLTYLVMSENDPGLMARTWTCEQADHNFPQYSAFPAPQIQLNVSYTVAQLLEYMVVHSDNRATVLLLRHMPMERYFKTFTDLGLPKPTSEGLYYPMNVRDYSVFMKALYNSSLLSPMDSEYALELMTRASFKDGLAGGLPSDVEMAHKFGEAGTEAERQVHETGLVYAEGNPYLITVMTRGTDPDSLASAIASISKLIYEHMRAS